MLLYTRLNILMPFRIILVAIFLIASGAYSTLVFSQNTLGNPSEKEAQERQRIQNERTQANAQYQAARKDCYQKFVVIACQNEAKKIRDSKLNDLKRQDTALNDAQRKRQAVRAQERIDSKSSNDAVEQKNRERAKALQESVNKETRRANKLSKREQNMAAKASTPSKNKSAKSPPQPRAKLKTAHAVKPPPSAAAGRTEKIQKALLDAQKRDADYAKRQAQMLQKEQQRKKPAAAGLPIPLEAK